jgi:hypothetical protein
LQFLFSFYSSKLSHIFVRISKVTYETYAIKIPG